ncbi:MAG TPA: cytochrome c [Candidatus Tumulicola sp.]|jgi:mono/diheme cytochrome c family protein
MRLLKGIVVGVVLTIVVIAIGGLVALRTGMVPANADARPNGLEEWAARASLRATMHREAPNVNNPLPLNDANVLAGVKLYAQNCALCHGDSSGNPSNVAKGLYQHAPQFAHHGVEDDADGYTYWKVTHGIRWTGMPSFGGSLSDTQIWQVALFLKHMDSLSPTAQRAWSQVSVDK